MEEWLSLDFLGYPKYKISDQGNIKGPQGIRKLTTDRDVYKNIILYHNNKGTNFKVSRLVALAFIPTDDISLQVDHKNRDRAKNNKDNLQWMTNKDNCRKSLKSSINDDIASKVRNEYKPYEVGHTMKDLMIKYGLSYNIVQNIIYNKCWS